MMAMMTIAGCEFGRERPTMPVLGQLEVRSDPSGATIFLDTRNTGSATPATIDASAGNHTLRLELRTSSELFVWSGAVTVPETALVVVDAALAGGCFADCPFRVANRVECVIVGLGDFCSTVFNPSQPDANEWPVGSGNEYVANLRVQAAGIVDADGGGFAGDTVASLVYQDTWLGRSTVSIATSAADERASFRYWSDAGPFVSRLLLVGLEVDQRVIAPKNAELQNVVYFRFRLHNVTDDSRHRHWHPEIPEGGFTYTGLYAGMALDADIGNPADDVGTYLPDPGVAFIYDLDFRDTGLASGYETMPPLVGLILVEAPPAARRPFSLWPIGSDWDKGAGTGDDDYRFGYRVLSAQLSAGDPIADCPGDEIGHCSDDPKDYRLSLTAGPLKLAPGDSAVYTLALVFAEPVPGTFTSGTSLPPGEPLTAGRGIEPVADSLVARARRAVALWPNVFP